MEHNWATYGLDFILPYNPQEGIPSSKLYARGSSASAWNAIMAKERVQRSSAVAASPVKSDMVMQVEEAVAPPVLQCPDCGKTFDNKSNFALHRKMHDGNERPYQCRWCEWSFRQLSHLKSHCQRKHPNEDQGLITAHNASKPKTSPKKVQKPVNPSPLDSMGNIKISGFKRDREANGDDEEEPDEFTMSAPIMEAHQSNVHTQDQIEVLIPDVISTEEAVPHQETVEEDVLGSFLEALKENKNYRCPICLFVFKQAKGVDEHLPSHEPGAVHECYFCQREFPSVNDLIEHCRGHSRDKQFQCKQCGREFRAKSGLRTHALRNHGNKKPKPDSKSSSRKSSLAPVPSDAPELVE